MADVSPLEPRATTERQGGAASACGCGAPVYSLDLLLNMSFNRGMDAPITGQRSIARRRVAVACEGHSLAADQRSGARYLQWSHRLSPAALLDTLYVIRRGYDR